MSLGGIAPLAYSSRVDFARGNYRRHTLGSSLPVPARTTRSFTAVSLYIAILAQRATLVNPMRETNAMRESPQSSLHTPVEYAIIEGRHTRLLAGVHIETVS